jgi:hypothetical protein
MIYHFYDIEIEQDDKSGYINLTTLCDQYGKTIIKWEGLEQKKFLKDFRKAYESFRKVNQLNPQLAIYGTGYRWGHPIVAIKVAYWLCRELGMWCDLNFRFDEKNLGKKGNFKKDYAEKKTTAQPTDTETLRYIVGAETIKPIAQKQATPHRDMVDYINAATILNKMEEGRLKDLLMQYLIEDIAAYKKELNRHSKR